jgi:ABC-type Fe3+-siderophore transport system permease subunit
MEYLIPRLLAGLLSGIILSQSGSFIQLSTRNLLASSSTLGLDGLAVLWILLVHSLFLLFHIQAPMVVLVSGIVVFVGMGFFFSEFILKHKKIEKLVLMGLTFNLFVGAIFSLWQFLFLALNLPFPVELWFGHFRYADWPSVFILISTEMMILGGWFYLNQRIALFSLGATVARNYQLDKRIVFRFLFISLSVGTFIVIQLFGAFSFLGLVFPILARKFWFRRFDLSGEIILGAVVNGLGLMLVDGLCYFLPVLGAEIPVGLIATMVGAVSLIVLLGKSDNQLDILAKT